MCIRDRAASSTLSRRYRRVSFMELERKPLKMVRGLGRPAEALLHEGLESVHRFGLAVHETHTTRLGGKRAQPSNDLTSVGMRRHRIDLRNPRVHRNRLSV